MEFSLGFSGEENPKCKHCVCCKNGCSVTHLLVDLKTFHQLNRLHDVESDCSCEC